jgi:hypothetical protein
MAWEKRGPFAGNIDRNGKGSDRRPNQVPDEVVEHNGAQTFGEDWLVPPVLRRKRQQQAAGNDS